MGQVQNRPRTHTRINARAHRIRGQMTLPFVRGSGFCRGRGGGEEAEGGEEKERKKKFSLISNEVLRSCEAFYRTLVASDAVRVKSVRRQLGGQEGNSREEEEEESW